MQHLNLKKNFFPNFADPVPLGHPRGHQLIVPAEQSSEVSCNTKNAVEEAVDDEENEDSVKDSLKDSVNISDDKVKWIIFLFFQNVCPATLTQVEGCNNSQCQFNHAVPATMHLSNQLLRYSQKDATEVFEFVSKLPRLHRIKFYPAFAAVFAKHRRMEMLKTLIRDSQKVDPADGFHCIIDALLRNKWSMFDAIQFVIENHIDSQEARNQILKLIGTSGSDVIKFTDYLLNVGGK